jgi:hypothetical protein
MIVGSSARRNSGDDARDLAGGTAGVESVEMSVRDVLTWLAQVPKWSGRD